jgi:hypothetical protein
MWESGWGAGWDLTTNHKRKKGKKKISKERKRTLILSFQIFKYDY